MAHWNLFDLVNSVILKFPADDLWFRAVFSFWNIGMSTLITIIITYYLLIIIVIIITKCHNNYCSVGVMELCLLNLLILIVFCVILVCSLRTCHMWLTRNHMLIRENLPRSFFEIFKSSSFNLGDFKISKQWTR